MVKSRKMRAKGNNFGNYQKLKCDLDKKTEGGWADKLDKVKEEWDEKHREFKYKQAHLESLKKELTLVDDEINRLESKLSYRRKRLRQLAVEVSAAKSRYMEEEWHGKLKFPIIYSNELKKKRRGNKTENGMKMSERRKQTWNTAKLIHGGEEYDREPALEGLFDTLCSKDSSLRLTSRILNSKHKKLLTLRKTVISKWVKGFQNSKANIKRSLNTYYAHCPTGVRKYESMRKAGKVSYKGEMIPNLVPYSRLALEIKDIDIGDVRDINPDLTTNYKISEVPGKYRNMCTYMPRLAEFYLEANKRRKDKLHEFPSFDDEKKDKDSFVFVIAMGIDGAPICGTTFLVSFMNVGERLACSDEIYMTFGTDADETAEVVRNYLNILLKELAWLESNLFNIKLKGGETVQVEFKVGELPSDMKMLCYLAGELSNSANFFTTFARVSSGKPDPNSKDKKKAKPNRYYHRNINGTFGEKESDTWRPYTFEERSSCAKKVGEFKAADAKSGLSQKPEAVHNRLTTYIGDVLECRQKEEPLIGKYVEKVKYEPLHGKNNTVKELFVKLLKHASNYINIGTTKKFKFLSASDPLPMLVRYVHRVMRCNLLAKNLRSWFNDNGGKVENDFKYRFKGQESRGFLSHFPGMVCLLLSKVRGNDISKVLVVHKQAIRLRKLVSLSVRITNITAADLDEGKTIAQNMFKVAVKQYDSLSPSTWGMSQVMIPHSEETFRKYKFGLGCNTMEGREQKHQKIEEYQNHATYQTRWDWAFRHEYIHLIYLRENGFDKLTYRKRSINYVPTGGENTCKKCVGTTFDGVCKMCDHPVSLKLD